MRRNLSHVVGLLLVDLDIESLAKIRVLALNGIEGINYGQHKLYHHRQKRKNDLLNFVAVFVVVIVIHIFYLGVNHFAVDDEAANRRHCPKENYQDKSFRVEVSRLEFASDQLESALQKLHPNSCHEHSVPVTLDTVELVVPVGKEDSVD